MPMTSRRLCINPIFSPSIDVNEFSLEKDVVDGKINFEKYVIFILCIMY